MLTLDHLISDINGSTGLSKLDLFKAYDQLELDEASRQVTTFTTHAGIRRYKHFCFEWMQLPRYSKTPDQKY